MTRPPESGCTLVIDQGTHATRCVLFDTSGHELASFEEVVELQRAGARVEQDAAELLASVRRVLRAALDQASTSAVEITAAALATQRSTIVAWDQASGEPIAPALSWQDTRAARRLARLEPHAMEIERRTGLRLSPHYGASKLAWLLDQVPSVKEAADEGRLAFGPLAAFLLAHLVGRHPMVVDHANAARTLLLNIETREWDGRLLDLFGIRPELLPSPRPIRAHYGHLRDTRIPLCAVTGDQNAAVLGDGDLPQRTAFANLGSGAFLLLPTGPHRLLRPPLLTGLIDSTTDGARYALEGTVNGAGSALTWARKSYHWDIPDSALDQVLDRCKTPPLFINTVGGLGSPWWQTDTAPHWLDQGTRLVPDAEHGLAAILESIAFMLTANLDTMRKAGCSLEGLVLGGGLSRVDGLCQRIADLGQVMVLRRRQTEATARGAAWLARGCPEDWRAEPADRFRPEQNDRLDRRYRGFVTAIERVLGA